MFVRLSLLEKIFKNVWSSLRARRNMKNLVKMILQDTMENIRSNTRTPLATEVDRETISKTLNGSAELATSSMEDVPNEGRWQENSQQ